MDKIQEGIAMLSALGSMIDDEGYSHHGDIWIEGIDEEKLQLIQYILRYIGFDDIEAYYEFIYDDKMYKEKEPPFPQHLYNEYVNAIRIKKNKMENKY